jgi:hypothetical protein
MEEAVLNLLDESLEGFLRAVVPLPTKDVDISFDAPDAEWSAGVTKPTVNLYLWDLRQSVERRESGVEVVELDGVLIRRRPPPQVDCRYLVTAWTSEVRDEHALLGAVLGALLQHDHLGPEYLQGAYAPVRPVPRLTVASPDVKDTADFWSAVGGQLKPGLDLQVTATVDVALTTAVGPPVEEFDVVLRDLYVRARASDQRLVGATAGPDRAGARVTSPRGSSFVDSDGRYVVRAGSVDEVAVDDD